MPIRIMNGFINAQENMVRCSHGYIRTVPSDMKVDMTIESMKPISNVTNVFRIHKFQKIKINDQP
jgi:hypothetical protein